MKDERASAEARLRSFHEELPVHERVRNRREAKGWTGAELAKRAGVSPAYVSLIERGHKVPAEDVAVAIARSLQDDPDLYRHWARAGRHPTTIEARRRYDPISADVQLRRSLAAGEPLHRINLLNPERVATPRPRDAASPAIPVPVLAEGADPGRPGMPLPASSDVLWLDARVLPHQGRGELFAYAITETPAGSVQTGSFLVMSRRVRSVAANRTYAVRLGQRIGLRRVVLKKNVLILLPPQGGSDFETINVESLQDTLDRLAAITVLEVRRWQ